MDVLKSSKFTIADESAQFQNRRMVLQDVPTMRIRLRSDANCTSSRPSSARSARGFSTYTSLSCIKHLRELKMQCCWRSNDHTINFFIV